MRLFIGTVISAALLFAGPTTGETPQDYLDPAQYAPASNPIDLFRHFWADNHFGAGEGRETTSIRVYERYFSTMIEVERTGFSDDSVDGERYRALVAKNDDGLWIVQDIELEWKCARGGLREGVWGKSLCP